MKAKSTLYLVVPCYNEEEVLPETSRRLREKLTALIGAGKVSEKSRVLFVNDGSRDRTWELIAGLPEADPIFSGSPPGERAEPVPEPGASECGAGGADVRKKARRCGDLSRCRPAG